MIDIETNVVSLSSMRMRRIRVNKKPGDKRSFPRKESSDRLFVQVTDSESAPELRGLTLSCISVDTSATGIGCTARRELPVHTRVDLWIEAPGKRGKFFLSGQIRWCRPVEDRFSVGIELLTGSATDFIAWREHHASRFGARG